MTLYGTRGNSGAQLSKVLFSHQIGVKDYKSMVKKLHSLIDKTVKSNANVLSSPNFIYSQKEYKVLPDFSQTVEKYFLQNHNNWILLTATQKPLRPLIRT
jgi:serine protease inhibitor